MRYVAQCMVLIGCQTAQRHTRRNEQELRFRCRFAIPPDGVSDTAIV